MGSDRAPDCMKLSTYRNGGYNVTIYDDGTKVREQLTAEPVKFPESVDLKITDHCDAGCPYCHEMSTRRGKHGALAWAANLWDKIPAGVEIAIGGGNPLDHPWLMEFLTLSRSRGHICNLTMNQIHLSAYGRELDHLCDLGLVRGLGISARFSTDHGQSLADLAQLVIDSRARWPHVVYHMILGVHTWEHLLALKERLPDSKVLLLGYKTFGRGVGYALGAASGSLLSHGRWQSYVGNLLKLPGTISFDNLAIRQLNLKSWLPPAQWAQIYMGDDGDFTCYVDAVERVAAVSSTTPVQHRLRIHDGTDLCGVFMDVRELAARVREANELRARHGQPAL